MGQSARTLPIAMFGPSHSILCRYSFKQYCDAVDYDFNCYQNGEYTVNVVTFVFVAMDVFRTRGQANNFIFKQFKEK